MTPSVLDGALLCGSHPVLNRSESLEGLDRASSAAGTRAGAGGLGEPPQSHRLVAAEIVQMTAASIPDQFL